jgi:hypothetical protein
MGSGVEQEPTLTPMQWEMLDAVSGLPEEFQEQVLEAGTPIKSAVYMMNLEGLVREDVWMTTNDKIFEVHNKFKDSEEVRREDNEKSQKLLSEMSKGYKLTDKDMEWINERNRRQDNNYGQPQ